MKLFCWFAVLSSSLAFSQTLTVKPNLHVGDTFSVEIVHTREDSSRPQNNAKTTTPNRVSVAKSGPDGILLDWVMGETKYADPAQAANPIVAAASAIVKDLQLRIKLSADGEFAGLDNQAEVMPRLQSVADSVTKQVMTQIPEAQRPQVENVLKQAFQPAVLLSSATREIEMYFTLHGAELDLGKPVEVSLQQPNPLTGTPVTAKVKIGLDKMDAASATLSIQSTYAPETLKEIVKQMVAAAGGNMPEDQMPTLTMQDGGTYLYDRASGLMQQVTYTRKTQAGPQGRSDVYQIRLVTPPKRP
jgi:hypothetical protein